MKKLIFLAIVSIFSLNIFAQNDDNVLLWAETMPEYPGGNAALRTYIAQNVVYPQQAIDNNISGTVYVRFVVSKTGAVINPMVMRGVDPILDNAALAVCGTIPDFTPGQQKGQNVSVWYSVPIVFQLNNNNNDDDKGKKGGGDDDDDNDHGKH